ncbi:hypothetical protein B296_00023558 [Ensete ventricosum]|uniref:Uncharacterized protein n=1 Tax=Ensete ventricosum TaxID=4639 RepID=A0A427ANN5_ENSVE|nr:hypothetical protein B296_00023558 [Ensete ventricosum]
MVSQPRFAILYRTTQYTSPIEDRYVWWMAATLIDFYINVFAISYVQMYTSLIIPFLWRKNDLCYWLPGMGCSQGVNLDQCILLDLFVDMLWQVCI